MQLNFFENYVSSKIFFNFMKNSPLYPRLIVSQQSDADQLLVVKDVAASADWLPVVCSQREERIQLSQLPIDQEAAEEITSSFLRVCVDAGRKLSS